MPIDEKKDKYRNRQNKRPGMSAVERIPRTKIKDITRLLLFVRAGGRCEFDGCNKYLLQHHLTLTEGNFAQLAHIVAFKPEGPRGKVGPRPMDINDVTNLMLLCPECHREEMEKWGTVIGK